MASGKVTLVTVDPNPCGYFPDGRKSRHLIVLPSFQENVEGNPLTPKALFPLFAIGVTNNGEYAVINNCPTCNACVPLRVNIGKFDTTSTQDKLLSNTTFSFLRTSDIPAEKMFPVFQRYIGERHKEKTSLMNKWGFAEFKNWYENASHLLVATNDKRQILGFSLLLSDGESLSLKYSVFDPYFSKLSVGKQLWLGTMLKAKDFGVDHVYVGSWAKGSPKLDYKRLHSGLETIIDGECVDFNPDVQIQAPTMRQS